MQTVRRDREFSLKIPSALPQLTLFSVVMNRQRNLPPMIDMDRIEWVFAAMVVIGLAMMTVAIWMW
jgi:hypothetical protein